MSYVTDHDDDQTQWQKTLFFHWQHRCSCPWPNHAKAFNILWCCSFTEQRWQLGLPATSFELQNIELFFQNGNRVVKQLGKADPRWVITITNHIKVIPLAHARAFTHTSKAPETKLTSNIVVKNPRESLLAIISSKRSLDLPPFANDGDVGIQTIQRVHHRSLGYIYKDEI